MLKVSSLPRKTDWSNRQEFYRHPKHFQPTATPYYTTSPPYPTTPLPYPTTSIYPYQEPQPELRIIRPIDHQNEIHHELPSFFKVRNLKSIFNPEDCIYLVTVFFLLWFSNFISLYITSGYAPRGL